MSTEPKTRLLVMFLLLTPVAGCNSTLFPNNFESGVATTLLIAGGVWFYRTFMSTDASSLRNASSRSIRPQSGNDEYEVGSRLLNSHDSNDSYEEAERQLTKAAALGHGKAQFLLAGSYALGNTLPKDEVKAAHFARLAAKQGLPEAQCMLGYIYSEGRAVNVDHTEACRWWHLAANQGNVDAQCALGDMYENGLGTLSEGSASTLEVAVYWYLKAAEAGNPVARFCLGVMYAEGRGVPQNLDEGYRLIALARRDGIDEAIPSLADIEKEHFRSAELRFTHTLQNAMVRSQTILSIKISPSQITQALDHVQTDLDASFYIIGDLEKPIVAWFKFGIAADFSSSPIKLSELREVFGYHKDLLGGGEDQVSFKVFAERVKNIVR